MTPRKPASGRGVNPAHPLQQLRQLTLQRLLLSLPELGTAFQYQVTPRQTGHAFQFAEHVNRELATARAKLQDIATVQRLQYRAACVGKTASEQR